MALVTAYIKESTILDLAKRLAKQRAKCTNPGPDGGCLYSDSKGNHCAVGWLLTPEELQHVERAELGGESVTALPENMLTRLAADHAVPGVGMDGVMDALSQLQAWHDKRQHVGFGPNFEQLLADNWNQPEETLAVAILQALRNLEIYPRY